MLTHNLSHQINWTDLSGIHDLPNGKGSLTQVCTGNWKGYVVAIKKHVQPSLPNHLKSQFDVYRTLVHPHLATFYGLCTDPGRFCIIMELAPKTLHTFIVQHSSALKELFEKQLDRKEISELEILEMGIGIGKGLNYLHSHQIKHGYLKPKNVLLTPMNICEWDECANEMVYKTKLVPKLTDYDLSKLRLESSCYYTNPECETNKWRAPETFSKRFGQDTSNIKIRLCADIFSYGVLLWSLCAGKFPFETCTESQAITKLMMGVEARQEINPKWADFYKTLLNDCWSGISQQPTDFHRTLIDTSGRPTAEAIVKRLEGRVKAQRATPNEGIKQSPTGEIVPCSDP